MADEERTVGPTGRPGEKVSRRGFLRTVMWASAGLALLEGALAGLAMFWPRKVEGFGSTIVAGKVSDFPVGSVTMVRAGKLYISMFPEGFIALYWRCVHLGCTVPWLPDQQHFHCPCHASVYEANGQNVAGPAPRPLDYMYSYVRDGRIYVDTGKIIERDVHRPEHLTKV